MWEVVGWIVAALAVGVPFWALQRLLRDSQAEDRSYSGDSGPVV